MHYHSTNDRNVSVYLMNSIVPPEPLYNDIITNRHTTMGRIPVLDVLMNNNTLSAHVMLFYWW